MMCLDIHIPDEILSEILTPLLQLSDDVFDDRRSKPLLAPGFSSSTYLLVCKAWLRIATPLLYSVVLLRTTAQAAALEAVLQANEDFELFIKKLRLEGGFGDAMHNILRCSPNITEFYMTLDVWGSDTPTGLCSGLSCINPQRVILVDKLRDNNRNKKLFKALLAVIPQWNNLTTFEFPYLYDLSGDEGLVARRRGEALGLGLSRSPSLQTVLAEWGNAFPPNLRLLVALPTLKALHFTYPDHFRGRDDELKDMVGLYRTLLRSFQEDVNRFNDERLKRFVTYSTLPEYPPPPTAPSQPAPPADQSSSPPTSASAQDLTQLYELADAPSSENLILTSFPSLRDLNWCESGCIAASPALPVLPSTLDHLVELQIHGDAEVFLEAVTPFSLPSLREVYISWKVDRVGAFGFLDVHGSKLLHLSAPIDILEGIDVMEACPLLRCLEIERPTEGYEDAGEELITDTSEHDTLQVIQFDYRL
ncbi:F-box domain-containing protein [Favolaschia claudopus]|uniref:F-box domain-containing protein n=1 Tax=Favolaschia claudopus TaxID=2862362 RepID=A0AAW0DDU5_9AGAR